MNRADAGQGPPVTWFGLVFEVVELGDRHGRVVLDDAIHAEQVLGVVDAVGDQLKGVRRKGGRAADLHEVVPSRISGGGRRPGFPAHRSPCYFSARFPSEQNRARRPANHR